MEKKYPADKLLIARPWIVDRDYSIDTSVLDKMIVKASSLEFLLTDSEINKKFPNADSVEIRTIVLKQALFSLVVLPTLNGYEDVLSGTVYDSDAYLSNCSNGEVYVLSDQCPGIKDGMRSFIDELSREQFTRDYLLAINLELTKEEIDIFMKMYQEQKKNQKSKTLTLRNYVIHENGASRFEKF